VPLLDSIYVIAILIAIVAAPFFFIAWFNGSSPRKRWRVFSVIALLFPICIVLGWLVSLTSTSIAQFKAHEFLDLISNQCVVRMNGKPVQNRDEILSALKTIRDLPAHHSSPTHTIDVQLSDPPRHLSLWVARDSSNPHEYWVFPPSPSRLASKAALKKDIGHVITTAFDQY
jgi:hypothetical protein